MPTITVVKRDLERLVGRRIPVNQLGPLLTYVKGEVKEHDRNTDEIRIELADSNRPDLWCVEGIARQIRGHLTGRPGIYPFSTKGTKDSLSLIVSPELKKVRPFIGACVAKGFRVTEETLLQIIQSQEKLSEIFGRKRRGISIGYYNAKRIVFPVFYRVADPEQARFVPLGFEEEMTLREILISHPKGQEYGEIIKQFSRYPLLVDAAGKVLSFPPIINSRDLGEVKEGDRELLVEVTGTDLRMVILTLNILAANLIDRGATIEPVEVRFPYPTEFGKRVIMPSVFSRPLMMTLSQVEKILGERITFTELVSHLSSAGYQIRRKGKGVLLSPPPYRGDVMHPVDVIEDFAISRGYNSFDPVMPHAFTVGDLSPLEVLANRIREYMVGSGFVEILSNILSCREDLVEKMELKQEKLVEIENVMSESFSALRQWIIPSLLRVEAKSSTAFYPHQIFEVGEVASFDETAEMGSRTSLRCAALIASASASFSQIRSYLEIVFYYLDIPYQLEPISHPSFIDGRVGRIISEKAEIGLIGEVHPQVLENWGITMPCAAYEFSVDPLLR